MDWLVGWLVGWLTLDYSHSITMLTYSFCKYDYSIEYDYNHQTRSINYDYILKDSDITRIAILNGMIIMQAYIDWLVAWLVGWLIGWLIDCLTDGLMEWSMDDWL